MDLLIGFAPTHRGQEIPLFLWGGGGRGADRKYGFAPAGLAQNHPWMLTTRGCPRTPDPRKWQVLSREIPCGGVPRLKAPWDEPTKMVNLSLGIPRVRGSRVSKGGEHPRVVLGQAKPGWYG